MFRPDEARSRLLVLAGAAATLAVLLLHAGSALAQQPTTALRIPADARGFQATEMIQSYWNSCADQGKQLRQTPAPSAAGRRGGFTFTIKVAAPQSEAATEYVVTRGPDGTIRTFPVRRGAIRMREVVVHPGETVTLSVAA